MDIHLHQGIPRRERQQLTYWHELGHLQTLPLALLHALTLWLIGRKRKGIPWTLRLSIGVLAWLAGWELAAEFYTMARAGQDYARLYRKAHTRLPTAAMFWTGMSGLAIAGTLWLLGGRKSDGQSENGDEDSIAVMPLLCDQPDVSYDCDRSILARC